MYIRNFLKLILPVFIGVLLLSACSTATNAASADATATNTVAATAFLNASAANPPPNGGPGGAPPGNAPAGDGTGSADAASGLTSATAVLILKGDTKTLTDQTYSASGTDQSGVYVLEGGSLTLTNPTILTEGNTSSEDNSSFYGLNAGVLAASGGQVTISGGTITTTGTGANGAFATGSGSKVTLTKVRIQASGDGGHGVMATLDGSVMLTDVDIVTSGAHAAPIATDRGGGTITVSGGTLSTAGQDSPCLYSTDVLTFTGSTCTASGSEAAVIEGANSITLTDTALTTSVENKWGVMIYQSFSGDAQGSKGTFSMTGGTLSLTASGGPLFYVTNSTGIITLKGVNLTAASGILLEAAANDRWGQSGANGGTALLTADGQTLTGNLIADPISSITVTLKNGSVLTGAFNADHSAKAANLTLDASSSWNVTADSHLTCLADSGGISGDTVTNITGNGRTVFYDKAACADLGGKTYSLVNGGYLTPEE